MLKAHEHLMDNTKRNNHKEADKPWCQKLADGLTETCGCNADKQKVKAASADGEPAEKNGNCLTGCLLKYVDDFA